MNFVNVPDCNEQECRQNDSSNAEDKDRINRDALQGSDEGGEAVYPGVYTSLGGAADTSETQQVEIPHRFHEDHTGVVRSSNLDPGIETSMLFPKLLSAAKNDGPLIHGIVKQEIPEMDDRQAFVRYDVDHKEKRDNFMLSCEDIKPVIHSNLPNPASESCSRQADCWTEFQDSDLSGSVMPVGLFYNTAHLGHSDKSEGRGSHPPMTSEYEQRGNSPAGFAKEIKTEFCDGGLPDIKDRYYRGEQDGRDDSINELVIDSLKFPTNRPVYDVNTDSCRTSTSSVLPATAAYCCKEMRLGKTYKSSDQSETGKKSYKCILCDQAFSQFEHLQTHELTHKGENLHECVVCSMKFSESNSLKIHERTHKKPFSCNVCGKSFPQLYLRRTHKRTHTGENPYSCDICNQSFAQSPNARTHKLTHTGTCTREKPYVCDICSMSFVGPYHLKRHVLNHISEKPYSCTICGKSFIRSSELETHKYAHTREKPYKCRYCSKEYKIERSLKCHEMTHTGEKHL